MPLDEKRCEMILEHMKVMDVDTRLKAINEAKVEFTKAFSGIMVDKDYAYSAYRLETSYNLLREELRTSQIRIKKDVNPPAPKSSGNSKPLSQKAKAKVEKPNLATLMAEFIASQKK